MNKAQRTALAWSLVAVFAVVSLVPRVFPGLLPVPLQSALMTLVPLVFFFVHGALSYRLRDLLVFAGLTLAVSNVLENLSVLTGFPFGHYVYTDVLGPRLFLVPVLIGPAYLGTGYLAWTIARVIAGAADARLGGHFGFTVPLLGSLIMVAWDLAFDPIFSTVGHSWIWRDGGSYFGVPVSNFMGWLLTTYVFLQLFALYVRAQPRLASTAQPLSRVHSLQAILLYGLIAARYVLNSLARDMPGTVADAAGVIWRVQDIYAGTGLVALFTMGVFTILGLVRLLDGSAIAWRAPSAAATLPAAAYGPEPQIDRATQHASGQR